MSSDSPASILYDEDGNAIHVAKDGTQVKIHVENVNHRELLSQILLELRKLNFIVGAFSEMSEVTTEDVGADEEIS